MPHAVLAQNKTSDTSAAAMQTRARSADSIVAVINTEVITRKELQQRLELIESRMKAQQISIPPQAEFQKQVLERLIVDRLELQAAKEAGIKVDDSMLDRATLRIAEQNKMSLQDFRNQLEKDGISFVSFRDDLREQILMQRIREREVDNKIQVSNSEVDSYLADQGHSIQAQQEFDIAQILVRIPENASNAQLADRQQRVDLALQQLKQGADFGTVAAAYSDASDALSGGDLGWRNADRLPQIFLDAVANLKSGEIAPLVKSGNGFHILKLVGKRSAQSDKSVGAAPVQQTHARHILIKVNQVVSASDARRKLLELKERLNNNAAKFEDLAKLYSNDLSAAKGGDLGWIYPGDTVPEFERAMDALKPGEVSEPIESPFGYHLIQVLERKTDDVSQERVRTAARQAIRERKMDEETQNWVRQLRDQAYVEYRSDDK